MFLLFGFNKRRPSKCSHECSHACSMHVFQPPVFCSFGQSGAPVYMISSFADHETIKKHGDQSPDAVPKLQNPES
ncbi:hypothetical protein L596_004705 [Steinernema carpocapsae]|uniref:Uncharacterized protein n=1 Tax=Steinernema carpocapsae TaxID=34508 RepID=A0A4U8UWM2_STECR|nr:hypothetical protein L596_004705 [Steinernema carpocapsae]